MSLQTLFKKRCPVRTKDLMHELSTPQFMKLRQSMLNLIESREFSDYSEEEIRLISLDSQDWLYFKDDVRWKVQYEAFKSILDTREHYPSKLERKVLRQQRAKSRR
jgi:hypothetical protein